MDQSTIVFATKSHVSLVLFAAQYDIAKRYGWGVAFVMIVVASCAIIGLKI